MHPHTQHAQSDSGNPILNSNSPTLKSNPLKGDISVSTGKEFNSEIRSSGSSPFESPKEPLKERSHPPSLSELISGGPGADTSKGRPNRKPLQDGRPSLQELAKGGSDSRSSKQPTLSQLMSASAKEFSGSPQPSLSDLMKSGGCHPQTTPPPTPPTLSELMSKKDSTTTELCKVKGDTGKSPTSGASLTELMKSSLPSPQRTPNKEKEAPSTLFALLREKPESARRPPSSQSLRLFNIPYGWPSTTKVGAKEVTLSSLMASQKEKKKKEDGIVPSDHVTPPNIAPKIRTMPSGIAQESGLIASSFKESSDVVRTVGHHIPIHSTIKIQFDLPSIKPSPTGIAVCKTCISFGSKYSSIQSAIFQSFVEDWYCMETRPFTFATPSPDDYILDKQARFINKNI